MRTGKRNTIVKSNGQWKKEQAARHNERYEMERKREQSILERLATIDDAGERSFDVIVVGGGQKDQLRQR